MHDRDPSCVGITPVYFLPRNRIRPLRVRWLVPKKDKKPGEFMLLSTTVAFWRSVTSSRPTRAAQRYPRKTNLRSTAGFRVKKSGNWCAAGPATSRPNWSTVTKGNPLCHSMEQAKSNFFSFQNNGVEPQAVTRLGASQRSGPPTCVPVVKLSSEKSTLSLERALERV